MPSQNEIDVLLTTLASAPARIAAAIGDWPASALHTPLGADEWPAAQLFAHIRASDDVLAYRTYLILSQDHPLYHDIDERAWESAVRYVDVPFAASMQAFALRRAELVQMLRRASDADWGRAGQHEQRGEQTLWTVASYLSEHEEEHVAQVQSLARRRALLQAMAHGLRLKDHRDIEGRKGFMLHREDDSGAPVNEADVAALVNAGLIDSNKKFPAATYWLTEPGRAVMGAGA
jgi:hypothetical protein